MPRPRKLDGSALLEALLDEIDARFGRALASAVRDLHRRIDRLERTLLGRGKEGAVPSFKVCRKPGCNGRVIAHGLCSRHYQQWRYHLRKAEATERPEPAAAAPVATARKAAQASATSKPRAPRPRAARARGKPTTTPT